MIPTDFDYVAPASLEDAAGRLSAGARLLAGGQGLLTELKAGRAMPSLVVSLGKIPGLAELGTGSDGGLRCGAMVTIDALAASDQLRAPASALTDMCQVFGDPQVRNRATVGGALANTQPGVDLPAVAVALGATITTFGSGGEATVPADEFFDGKSGPAAGGGDIITGVDLPLGGAGTGSAYEKVRDPGSGYALCGVAALVVLDGETVAQCRLAVSGATRPAARLATVELGVVGREATEDTFASAAGHLGEADVEFRSDLAAPADYRAHLAEVLVARALAAAARRARAAQP